MKRLKILYTIPNFNTAGSGKVLYDLANRIDDTKFEIHIACSHNKGAFFAEIEKLGIPIHIIDTTCAIRPYYSLLGRLRSFKAFIKKNQFDIVHSWNWSSDWTEVVATRLAGAKYVYTKKAMTWGNIHWKIKSLLSDFIVTINDEMRNFFLYKKAQKLIPIGIDFNYYSSLKIYENKNNKVFKIITVANLVPVKNIEVIIKAVSLLNNSSIILEIVGDDKTIYAKQLSNLVKELGLEKHVFFTGKQLDVRPFFSNADLYIISSVKEGLGVALIEAMAMSLPVLGANVSGINFILKEYPDLLFCYSDYQELGEKINMMVSKSEIERMYLGNQLREYCVKNFSLDKFIQAHEELYFNLIKKK